MYMASIKMSSSLVLYRGLFGPIGSYTHIPPPYFNNYELILVMLKRNNILPIPCFAMSMELARYYFFSWDRLSEIINAKLCELRHLYR